MAGPPERMSFLLEALTHTEPIVQSIGSKVSSDFIFPR
jgi:hypothetical protein